MNLSKHLKIKRPENLHYVSQTTLSVEDTRQIIAALKARFPEIRGPKREDICYATTNRQDAVKYLAQKAELVIVVGSVNSSNSNRLREIAEKEGCDAFLIDDASELNQRWFDGKKSVGVTAGASAPEILVERVINQLKAWGGDVVTELPGRVETIEFALPKVLRQIIYEN